MTKQKTLPGSKVAFTLTIDPKELMQAQKGVVSRAKNELSLKGFRKGHAPDQLVMQTIGPQRLYQEAFNDALDKIYRAYVMTNKLAVISAPKIDIQTPETKEGSEPAPIPVKVEVEVFPEVKLGDYKKIKVSVEKTAVTDQEVRNVIETVCAQMNLAKSVDRAAKKNDMIIADFKGLDENGEVLAGTAGEKQQFRLGLGHFLADLEKGFEGMKAGDSKAGVKVKFPKDYHNSDFAGKTIPFDIQVHEVLAIDVDALTEDEIQQISGKKQNMEGLNEQIKETITANKKREAEKKAMDEYTKALSGLVTVDMPASWIEKEVHTRMNQLQSNPQFQKNPNAFWQSMGSDEQKYREQMKLQGERDLKVFLGLSEIVKTEKIELDKDEVAAINQSGKNDANQIERDVLNRKIDKFLRQTIIEG